MTMSIQNAIDRLVVIEKALQITTPVAIRTSAVFAYPPKKSTPIVGTTTWWQWPEPNVDLRGNALMATYWIVHIQLLVNDAREDRSRRIAVAFHEQLSLAMHATTNVTLAGTCTLARNLRGGLRTLTWNGQDYPGLDLTLEVQLGPEAVP